MILSFKLFIIFSVFGGWFSTSDVHEAQNNWAATNEHQVQIKFIHKIGSEPLVMDTIMHTNLFGNKYSVATLRYFVSNITLQNEDGNKVQLHEVFYIDAVNNNISGFISSEKIPAGMYSGVSFIFGLDKATNVSGKFLNPPENRMEWPEPMGGGYHYMKLEGKIDSDGKIVNYQAHTGGLDGTQYFIEVSVGVPPFSVDDNIVTIPIIMDISSWWRDPNTIDLNNISGIMGSDFFQNQFMENGNDVFSIGNIH